jgi:hypothetical protein
VDDAENWRPIVKAYDQLERKFLRAQLDQIDKMFDKAWAQAQETSKVYAEDNDDYDDEIEVHPGGGRRSRVPERFDLVPGLLEVATVMGKGADKYGLDNWRKLPPESVINHAIRHLYLYLSGDRSENHAAHAACNCLMLIELEKGDDSR